MICKFDYNKIDTMPTTIVKIGKKAAKDEKAVNVIDYSRSNIVRKTLEMVETFRKYPRPARK